MKKEVYRIIAVRNGKPEGYVKSISYTKGTFQLTDTKSYARKFSTFDMVTAMIDDLTAMGFSQGYVFMCEESNA